jgi:hypothetical protein
VKWIRLCLAGIWLLVTASTLQCVTLGLEGSLSLRMLVYNATQIDRKGHLVMHGTIVQRNAMYKLTGPKALGYFRRAYRTTEDGETLQMHVHVPTLVYRLDIPSPRREPRISVLIFIALALGSAAVAPRCHVGCLVSTYT